jgi:hypothetical protein
LKLKKESISKNVSREVDKEGQVHDYLLTSPIVVSILATISQENNQQKENDVTELEEQLERKGKKINILIKKKKLE